MISFLRHYLHGSCCVRYRGIIFSFLRHFHEYLGTEAGFFKIILLLFAISNIGPGTNRSWIRIHRARKCTHSTGSQVLLALFNCQCFMWSVYVWTGGGRPPTIFDRNLPIVFVRVPNFAVSSANSRGTFRELAAAFRHIFVPFYTSLYMWWAQKKKNPRRPITENNPRSFRPPHPTKISYGRH